MITAEQLKTLMTFTPASLTRAVGRKEFTFTGAKFLGMTNGGQFCYTVTYPVAGGTDSTKVFLTHTHTGQVVADIHLTVLA